ncbi:MAG: sugar transporter, ATP-binding component [Acidimicrobiales bacterium]|jgi:ribose transport system ATP-binding protein|nr:sugar transporter, ATP-binding component [Acidimicrobiales bacterium]
MDNEAVLELHNVAKTFEGQVALYGLDLSIASGEIHGLVGHNGSGKSTLIKILAGFHRPDPGADGRLAGNALTFGSSTAAAAAGIRFVHQELGLIDELDVVDNLCLSRPYRRSGFIRLRRELRDAEAMLSSLGIHLDARRPVGEMRASDRVRVAIARAVDGYRQGAISLLVLDEPDTLLPTEEMNRLFDLIRTVASLGVAILYVSHNLSEVMDLADRITVLRDGERVWSGGSHQLQYEELVALVVGKPAEAEITEPKALIDLESEGPIFEAISVSGWVVDDVSVAVSRGEIVGLAGLAGSGRDEFPSIIGGAQECIAGELRVRGVVVKAGSPRRAAASGIVLMPSDRRRQGAVVKMNARENITLPTVGRSHALKWMGIRSERTDSRAWLQRIGVTPAAPDHPFETFSGGNQQKVLLARALRTNPAVLVLDDPFQGVDLGAVLAVSARLKDAARAGVAIIVASTDPAELVELCDRVLVFRGGRIAAELRGDDLTVANAFVESGGRTESSEPHGIAQ